MKRTLLTLTLLLACCVAAAQNANDRKIAEQKRIIADLEKKIAAEEREIADIKKGKKSQEEQARRLARQIDSRNQMLEATEREAELLRDEIARTDSVAGGLGTQLVRYKAQYAEMVREAYRNYRHNNYLTYLFSARDFADVARRITVIRSVASLRRQKMEEIARLSDEVAAEQQTLARRNASLDSVSQSLAAQKKKLQSDADAARAAINKLSKRERTALQQKVAKEQQLDVAINELRKLTKGNTAGNSFSAKTSGLHLPVVGGTVKKYKGNMAEVSGAKGAKVISIYEGKVVDIKRNRITNKYDVYVAHGEYITSYANLGSIVVEKGQKVAKDQPLGVVGSTVDVMTMKTEYKIVFGIYPPSPDQKMLAENCFKKK